MTPAETARTGALARALGAQWPERGRRATLHALAGAALALGVGTVLGTLVVVWTAAVWSLAEGPIGAPSLVALYAVAAVAVPPVLPWFVRAFGAVQRDRFRALLGVEIPPPPVGSWRSPALWRQLGYHLLALVAGTAGGAVVAACWSAPALALGYAWAGGTPAGAAPAAALFLAAPWAARGVARADEAAARRLLGPGRAAELALRVESLTRSRADVVAATDAERRRIERDLHDGAQRRLVYLAMNLGMARAGLADAPEPARLAVERAHDEAVQALAELRELVRGLHPAVLDDRGLDAALSGIAARSPVPVRLRVDAAPRCAPSIEAVAYFVVSEALTNVAKHAAAGRAEVTVERAGDRLRVVVFDDGRGGAALGAGTGLRGLAQRTAAVDGTLDVRSPAGGPTTITVELPCES